MNFRKNPSERSRITPGILLLFVFIISLGISGQQNVSEYKKRLADISRQIDQIKLRIQEEEKKESSLLSDLDRIGFNKNLIRKEISLYTMQLGNTNRELSSIQRRIPQLRAKLDREKNSIEKILVTMYKFGKLNQLQFIIQAKNMNTLVSESKNLTLLAQYQNRIIANYIDTLLQFRKAEEELEEKKKESSNLIWKTKNKRQELEVQEKKQKSLITEIKENKKMHLQALDELNERSRQLQSLIEKLLKDEISFPILIVPLYEQKGRLPWPLEGAVVSTFGRQVHPRFRTVTVNDGIEITPQKNQAVVKAIHPGKVVFSDYHKGFGNVIIIDHGMNFHSIYAHCADFLVKMGELVKTGQPISIVGDTGSLKGITLYFEIRSKAKPVDPLKWLKRR
ncbi:MAG: peptidoglycan DD-metalloendopeptidase family protein [Candidatus Aminicenantes bacterium]|nr:peptidoglycan DD-metalloendopeptidase family protein [Candidatus Aminicenantes bacterium]